MLCFGQILKEKNLNEMMGRAQFALEDMYKNESLCTKLKDDKHVASLS